VQDAGLTLLPQIQVQVGLGSRPAYQRCGKMDVEIIDDKVPTTGSRVGSNDSLDVGEKIGFSSSGAGIRCQHLARDHIATQDESKSAMASILELPTLHGPWLHGETWVLSFQGLHTSHLIRAYRALALFMQGWGLLIDGTDFIYLFVQVRIVWRRQPVANAVGLKVPLFSSRCTCRSEIFSTIFRSITSLASSLPDHWLMGRPDFSGASQARLTI
jgi:hypothetical protein